MQTGRQQRCTWHTFFWHTLSPCWETGHWWRHMYPHRWRAECDWPVCTSYQQLHQSVSKYDKHFLHCSSYWEAGRLFQWHLYLIFIRNEGCVSADRWRSAQRRSSVSNLIHCNAHERQQPCFAPPHPGLFCLGFGELAHSHSLTHSLTHAQVLHHYCYLLDYRSAPQQKLQRSAKWSEQHPDTDAHEQAQLTVSPEKLVLPPETHWGTELLPT